MTISSGMWSSMVTWSACRWRANIDAASAARLQRSLDAVIGVSAGAVVLDMSGVSFIDSTGLRVLVVLQQRLSAQRRLLTLGDVSVQTRRLLELSGLSSVFGVDGTS